MLFVKPPVEAYRDPSLEGQFYLASHGARTYAEYNYLNGGLGARVKLAHFEKVLRLCRESFGQVNVVDFGCADGVFLPSLSAYFPQVVGVDIREDFIQTSRVLVANLGLPNVTLHCNAELSTAELRRRMAPEPYHLAFILEVLEHVGDRERMYEDKIELLHRVFDLLADGGRVVVSVPKMVGAAFLAQRLGLTLLRLKREPVGFGELLRASFLRDADALEKRWANDHVGFNHDKLERWLDEAFDVVVKSGTFFQAIYVLERKSRR